MDQTMSPENDEELCVADLGDFHEVVDIDHHVYSGFDRLADYYAFNVQGPGVKGFVYKKKGKVVGFLSTRIIDNGMTLATAVGRISPEYRGLGMYGRFTRRVYDQFKDMPELRYTAMAITDKNIALNGDKIMRTYTLLSELAYKVFCIDAETFAEERRRSILDNIEDVALLSHEEVHVMMSRDPDDLRHLFPEGRLHLRPHWVPYRIMPENMHLILDENNEFLASNLTLSPLQMDRLYPGNLLSCGGYHDCPRGVLYNVDLFGSGGAESLRAHMGWHVTRLANIAMGRGTYMAIVYPKSMCSAMQEVLCRLPVKETFTAYNRTRVFEMNLAR